MPLIAVTLGAGATQVSPNAIYCSLITVANPTGGTALNVGDSTVSASRGIPVAAGDRYQVQPPSPIGRLLSAVWLYGTAGDVIQVDYEPA